MGIRVAASRPDFLFFKFSNSVYLHLIKRLSMSLFTITFPKEFYLKVEIIADHDMKKSLDKILDLLIDNKIKIKEIMSAQTDAAAVLVNIKTQLLKAKDEITTKIQTLIDAAGANSGTIDPALQAAIDDLAPIAQQLDDIVPDAPAPTPEPTV